MKFAGESLWSGIGAQGFFRAETRQLRAHFRDPLKNPLHGFKPAGVPSPILFGGDPALMLAPEEGMGGD